MYDFKAPYFGAAYYPEAWDRSEIDADLDRLVNHGLNTVRVAEFAWGTMEPEEGRYDFSLFREVVDKCKARGISVIMCTPSATPPSWMEHKYPEVLVSSGYKKAIHGARRNNCPTNPRYIGFVKSIVEAMAKEFGGDENIVGWQIDNEIIPLQMDTGCTCPDCVRDWHNYLKERYGTVENLNYAWGNYVWSIHYSSFDEVDAYTKDTWLSPVHKAVWTEYKSRAYVEFTRIQAEIIRKYSKAPIGTDMMPTPQFDIAGVNRCLDIAQLNFYNGPDDIPMWMDVYRPLFGRKFWVTETSANHNGSEKPMGPRGKGFCKANSLVGIALGGEACLYWLFRSHRGGHEIAHGSVIDAWGRDMQSSPEVRELSRDLSKLRPMIEGTKLKKSGIGIMFTFSSHVMGTHAAMISQDAAKVSWADDIKNNVHGPIAKLQYRPDMLSEYSDLSDYRLIISHRQYTIEDGDFQERIIEWVKNGGTWVVGPLTDIFTPDCAKHENAPFGILEDIAKVRREFYVPAEVSGIIHRQGNPSDLSFADGSVGKTRQLHYDAYTVGDGVKVIASYADGANDYLPGYAAITETKVGNGRIIMLGCGLENETYGRFISGLAAECGIEPVCDAGDDVVTSLLEGEWGEVFCAIEAKRMASYAVIPFDSKDILTDREYIAGERVELKPYACIFAKKTQV